MLGTLPLCLHGVQSWLALSQRIPPARRAPTGCRGRDGHGMLAGAEAHPAARWSRPTASCTGTGAATMGPSWHSQAQHPQLRGVRLGRHDGETDVAQRWGVTAEPPRLPRKHPLPQSYPGPRSHPRRRTCPARPLRGLSAHSAGRVRGGPAPAGHSWRASSSPGRLAGPQEHRASGLLVLVPWDMASVGMVGRTMLSVTLA